MNALSNYVVVVPSFHPVREYLLPLLDELGGLNPGAVIVVDDGSGGDYRDIFAEAEKKGCLVLRHERNKGKGESLKTAFRHCAEELPHLSGIVTADSDGLHAPEDIARVAARHEELTKSQALATVFGSRAFRGKGVPAKSRFGNVMTTGIIRVLFWRHIADTQSGLRCFSLGMARDLIDVRGQRFDYEMNKLLWLLATDKHLDELAIRTIYHDTSNSVSHFRPVRDSLRIYAIILRQFFVFFVFSGVSVVSAVVDLFLYFVLIDFAFGPGRSPAEVGAAVAIARLGSSVLNFALNRSLVFRATHSPTRAASRYYALAVAIMLSSAAGTAALSVLTDGHDMWAKIATDGTLFILSYVAQRRWVFVQTPSGDAVLTELHPEVGYRTP